MTKHTPGPWVYEIDGPAHNDMRHAVLAKSTGLWIAATYRSGTRAEDDTSLDADDEAKANAKLIAAAPDLKEALRSMLSLVRRNAPELSGKVLGDAEAALAKADGALFNTTNDRPPVRSI